MSTTFEIIKFQKPTMKELLVVDRFQPYDSYRILDEDSDDTDYGIYLFRMDDKSVSNLVNSRFGVKMVLPELEVDYEKLYEDLGFDTKEKNNKSVRVIRSNARFMDISDGVNTKHIKRIILKDYEIMVQISCIYGLDKEKIRKYIPDIKDYRYVPVNNSMLAKAEIPFLIFEKNRGKCFIEQY